MTGRPENFVILHHHNNGSYDVIKPLINPDGTCTFTVADFSVFVFVNSFVYPSGYVSGNERINMQDVLLIYQYFRGKTDLGNDEDRIIAADVNQDGKVDMKDVLMEYQYFRGMITGFLF